MKVSNKSLENLEEYERFPFGITSLPVAHLTHLKRLCVDDYDLVYGNGHVGTFFSTIGKLIRKPLIFDMHGGLVEEFLLVHGSTVDTKLTPKFFLTKLVDFVNLHISDKIICVSKKMMSYLQEEKKVPLEKMTYVTNAVDLEYFKPANSSKVIHIKDRLGLHGRFVFGYVGNMQRWQGVERILEVANHINDKEIVFLIVGGREKLRRNNVLFIPKAPRSHVLDYYAVSDVLMLPRTKHPATEIAAPTKFAEYAAMGKPILTTNVGDAGDSVKKYKCGIVIKDNEIENMVKGIVEFRETSADELEAMSTNSRKLAETEFDWKKIAPSLSSAIYSCVR
jgi:glycosyltransferase involved in cell wall biosynthesis